MTRVFLAGATGVIGRRLGPLLADAGCEVFGTTRSGRKAASLSNAGVTLVVIDVYDAPTVSAAMLEIKPEVVAHQLTDLPRDLDPARMDDAIRRNAEIRGE